MSGQAPGHESPASPAQKEQGLGGVLVSPTDRYKTRQGFGSSDLQQHLVLVLVTLTGVHRHKR
jgi:hypothetical protein